MGLASNYDLNPLAAVLNTHSVSSTRVKKEKEVQRAAKGRGKMLSHKTELSVKKLFPKSNLTKLQPFQNAKCVKQG